MKHSFSFHFRFTAAITLFFFTWTNIAGAEEWQGLLADKNLPALPVSAEAEAQKLSIPSDLSYEFLEDTLSLTNAEENLTAPEATDFSFKPEDEQLYLDPEQFVAKGPFKTQTHVFDYTYAVDGKLAKITQSKLVAEQQIAGGNLAAAILPTVSSYYEAANYHPSYATDGKLGDTGTPSWGGANAEGSQDWLQVDLGTAKNIGALKYDTRFHSYFGNDIWQSSFKISGSLDGINWFLLTEKESLTAPQLFTLLFEPKQVRYLKAHDIMSHYAAAEWWHFAYVNEIQAFETVPTGNTLIVREKEYRYSYNAQNQIEKISEGTDKEFVYERDAQGKILKIKQNTILQKDPTKNLLAGIAPAVSSTYDPSFSAANATDGKLGNDPVIGWAGSSINGSGEWLQVDLGSAKSIDHLKYDTRYNPSYGNSIWQSSFKISGSLDGVNWFLLTEKNGLTTPQLFDLTFNAQQVRYLRVHDIVSHYPLLADWWHFAYVQEIQAFEAAGVAEIQLQKEFAFDYDAQGRIQRLKTISPGLPEAPAVNLARGIMPAVSSTSQYEAVRATDGLLGDVAVGWTGANSDGSQDWLQVDLGSTQTINKLRYDTRFHPFFGNTIWQSSFKISGSLDGVNWFLLTEKSGLTTPQLFDLTFNPIQARYVRVHDIHSHYPGFADWWHFAYVNELEVYPYNAPPAAPEVTLTSPLFTNNASLSQLDFTVDGNAVIRSIPTLHEGENLRVLHFESSPGYQTDYFARVSLDTVPETIDFPEIEFLSPNFVQDSHYNLRYTINGVQEERPVLLQEGANILSVEKNNSNGKTTANFLVILNDLTVPQIPNEQLTLNLEFEGGSAIVHDPLFNAQGDLKESWVKTDGGINYRIKEGVISEEYHSDGTRLLYDSEGRIHSRVSPNLSITYFIYEYDSASNLVNILVREGLNQVTFDSNNQVKEFAKEDGSIFYFQNGKLARINQLGTQYLYTVSTEESGFRSQVIGPLPMDSKLPKTIDYDAALRMTQIVQADNSTFEFSPEGFIVRATDASGKTTEYDPQENSLGAVSELTSKRSGMRRIYDREGKLSKVIDAEGNEYVVTEGVISGVNQSDGTKYEEILYDAAGKLQSAKIITSDGMTIIFESGKMKRVIQTDGTAIEFSGNKPTRIVTPTGSKFDFLETSPAVFEANLKEFLNVKGGKAFIHNGRVNRVEETIQDSMFSTDLIYDSEGRVLQAVLKKGELLTDTFDYSYLSSSVVKVTNGAGTARIYENNELKKMTTADGKQYEFQSFQSPDGTFKTLQKFQQLLSDVNETVDYENGRPVRISRFDGLKIEEITVDSIGNLLSAQIVYNDGTIGVFEEGELKQIFETNGTREYFSNGRIQKVVTSNFEVTTFKYETGLQGQILRIILEDDDGQRTYSAQGVLEQAVTPDGTLFLYDASGHTTLIQTPAEEKYHYTDGVLSHITLATGEAFTGFVLDSQNRPVQGTFHAFDDSTWSIQNGTVTQVTESDNTRLQYLSSGTLEKISTPNGNVLSYNSGGSLTQIQWNDGFTTSAASIDSQDKVISGTLFGPFGNAAVFGSFPGRRQIINGEVQDLSDISTIGKFFHQTPNSWLTFNSNFYGGNGTYINLKLAGNGTFAFTFSKPFTPVVTVNYTFNFPTFREIMFPVPPGQWTNLRIDHTAALEIDTSFTPQIRESNSAAYASRLTLGSSYLDRKAPASLPLTLTTTLQKLADISLAAQRFLQAPAYSSAQVDESIFQTQTILNSVSEAKLPDSTILEALYDENMDLLSKTYANVDFNPLDNPNGSWTQSVRGWEDSGYRFFTVLMEPQDGSAIHIELDAEGRIKETRLQGGIDVEFENDRVKRVLTANGQSLSYSYLANLNQPALLSIFIDDAGEVEDTEIIYDLDRIREIRKLGSTIYRYSYEFDAQGKEIVVIEDVAAKEVRRFKDEELLSVYGLTTGFTTIYEYVAGRIGRAVTQRAGRIFSTYTYAYEGADTLIQDDAGTVRRYDSAGNIKRLQQSTGEIFNYSLQQDVLGEDLVLQELVQIANSTVGTVQYKEGQAIQIKTPSGIQIDGIKLDGKGKLLDGVMRFPAPDNRVVLIAGGEVIRITDGNGSLQEFSGGFLETLLINGEVTNLTYNKNPQGGIESIVLQDSNGTRTYAPEGDLIKSVLNDTTTFEYRNDGTLSRIRNAAGGILEYEENGMLGKVQFASGQGHLTEIQLNPDGTLKTANYASGNTRYEVSEGYVAGLTRFDGVLFHYHPNGMVKRIEKPVVGGFDKFFYDETGKLMSIERRDGTLISNITTNNNDELVGGTISYSPVFASGYIFGQGGATRILENGIVKNPDSPYRTLFPVIENQSTLTWEVRAGMYSDIGDLEGDDYLKIRVKGNATFDVSFQRYDGTILATNTYSFNFGETYQDAFLPIPAVAADSVFIRQRSEVFKFMDIDQSIHPVIYEIEPNNANLLVSLAKSFVNDKAAPTFPNIVTNALAPRESLELLAQAQFNFAAPPDADSNNHQPIFEQAHTILNSVRLSADKAVAAAHRQSDGELVMAARADRTVAHYINGKVSKVDDLDGNLFIEYEYDPNGDLIRVDLVDAKSKLETQRIQAERNIEFEKERSLEAASNVGDTTVQAAMERVRDGLFQIQLQRQSLLNLQQQKVCSKVLFFTTCKTLDLDISAELNQLTQEESHLFLQASGQLASFDTQVAAQKQQIETAALQAMTELENQFQITLTEIYKEELRPVVSHHYRAILGRDPSKQETDTHVNAALANVQEGEDPQIDILQIKTSLEPERIQRQTEVDQIRSSVRSFFENDYFPKDETGRAAALATLGLSSIDVIQVSPTEIETILDQWIDTRDLHFGHSAFISLQHLLNQGGGNVSLKDIGRHAILIDILTGVIHPLTSGDLELSLYSLNKIAAFYGVALTSAKVTWEELKRQLQTGKDVLIHMDTNHYAVVTELGLVERQDQNGNAVMVEGITYTEKNVGPNGEEVKLTVDEFLKLWIVTSQGDGVVLTPVTVAPEAKVLNEEEQKEITGSNVAAVVAFFAALGALIVGIVSAAAAAIAVAVTAIVSSVLAVVGAVLTAAITGIITAVQLIGTALVTFGQLAFAGVKFVAASLLHGLSSGFAFLKTGLAHFGSFLSFQGGAGFLAGSATPAQLIARQVIGVAVSFGSGKLFERLGFSPVVSRLTSAFVTGGVVGLAGNFFGLGTTFLGSSLQAFAIQGVNELALKINLPPPIANSLALLAGTLAGTILDPSTLPEAIRTLAPTLAQELAISGVTALGSAIGIDSRINQLAGTTLSSLFQVAGSLSGQGSLASLGKTIFGAAVSGLLKGAASIGIEAVGQALDLDPLVTSLSARAITGALEGALSGGSAGLFSGIFEAYKESTLKFLTFAGPGGGPVPEALFLSKVLNFSQIIEDQGLAEALKTYAAGIFHRDAAEQLIQVAALAGQNLQQYLAKKIQENKRVSIEVEGTSYQGLELENQKGIYLLYDTEGHLVGVKEGNRITISTDATIYQDAKTGEWILRNGKIIHFHEDGSRLVNTIQNGRLQEIILSDAQNNTVIKFQASSGDGIVFDDSGNIRTGSVVFDNDLKFTLKDGAIEKFSMEHSGSLTNFSAQSLLLSALSPGQAQPAFRFIIMNGINNRNSESLPPEYLTSLQMSLGNNTKTVLVPAFEASGPLMGPLQTIRDGLNWIYNSLGADEVVDLTLDVLGNMSDALFQSLGLNQILPFKNVSDITVDLARNVLEFMGINNLSREMQTKIDTYLTQHPLVPGEKINLVMYSGSGNSALELIERVDYPVDTMIFLGSPTLKGSGLLAGSSVDNPNVRRVINIYGEKDPVPFAGGSQTKDFGNTEVINIKILGANHFDYFPGTSGAITSGANNFVKQLIESSTDEQDLKLLLSQTTVNGDGSRTVNPQDFFP